MLDSLTIGKKILPNELKVGDVISTFTYRTGFETSIVYKIDDELIYLKRPFMVTGDFRTEYTGYEDFVIHKNSAPVLYFGNNHI